MTAKTSHNRRYLIAGAAVLAVAAGAFGLASVYPAFGPIAGSIAPQLYVDSLSGAQIPAQGRYLLVDAASARLYMMEDGRVRDSMKVIVGKPETPTPELKSVINYETLNPYWHVTPDLAKTIIAPRVLKDGDAYLKQQGYEVVSAFGPEGRVIPADSVDWKAVAAGEAQILVRQRPGPANSLPLQVRPSGRRRDLSPRYSEEGAFRPGRAQPQPWLRPPGGRAEAGDVAPRQGSARGRQPRREHSPAAARADHHQLPRSAQPELARRAPLRDGSPRFTASANPLRSVALF